MNHFVHIPGHYGTLWKEAIILLDSSVFLYTVSIKVEADSII